MPGHDVEQAIQTADPLTVREREAVELVSVA
jgi:hypothetical protein